MEIQEVINRVAQALKKCAEENNIPPKDVRVRISKSKGFLVSSIKSDVLSKSSYIKDADLQSLLGITPLQTPLLKGLLSKTLSDFAKKENIPEENINGRFYTTKEDFTPQLYLFNGNTPVREVKVEEFLT